jgi:hypothetical protein
MPQLPVWAQVLVQIAPALSAVIAAISAIFSAIGLARTARQSARANAQDRAALVAETLKGFTEDDEMSSMFYKIEYSQFRYTDKFHESPEERQLDKLLQHLSNLGLAWQAGLLSTL